MINKALSAGITLVFMAVVRPDPDVSKIGIVFVGILLYEALGWSIEYIRKNRKKKRYIKSATIKRKIVEKGRQDMERWSNTWLYHPLEEVI